MEKPTLETAAHELAMLYLSQKDLSTLSTRQITERYLTSYHDALRVLKAAEIKE